MNKYFLLRRLLAFIILICVSSHILAGETGCQGDDYKYTLEATENVELTFSFSMLCVLRNANPYSVARKYHIEAYWPGFVPHSEAMADKKNNYIRSYLSLSYHASPTMKISSEIRRIRSNEKLKAFETEKEYLILRKQGPSGLTEKTFYFHMHHTEFFVVCAELYCKINGGVDRVLYELELYTETTMDWLLLHETTSNFITKSLMSERDLSVVKADLSVYR